ncbi:MAG: ADOP family duplicated permease [Terriglobales bacterium]
MLRRRRANQDLDAELAAYAAEMAERGSRPVRTESVREQVRTARLGAGIEGWARDLRLGARRLWHAPLLALACILTFGLAIGANTVVFSMANALLWRQPPLAAPRQLDVLRVWRHGSPSSGLQPAEVAEIGQATSSVFSGVAPVSLTQVGVNVDGLSESAWATYVSGNFFSVLGVKPGRGRFFSSPDIEDRAPQVVISYDYWRLRFGGDPGVVGRRAQVDGKAVTIVGVGAKGFHGISELFDTQVFVPLGLETPTIDGAPRTAVARRRAGVSPAAVGAELEVLAARLARAHPQDFQGVKILVAPLGVGLMNDQGANPFPMVSALFLGLAGLVLLLAAANVTGLLLARASTRRREMAVRAALGGARRRLARQVFLETLLLALAGGALGLGLGALGSRAMSALPPHLAIPLQLDFGFDWRVAAYGLALALVVALVAGLAPAWRAAGAAPLDAMRDDGTGGGTRGQKLRSALVAAQVAGALALLIVGGLFVRSLRRAETANLGFDPVRVWNFSLDTDGAGYQQPQARQYYAAVLTRARALPGVVSASLAQTVPFGINSLFQGVRDAASPAGPRFPVRAAGYNPVSGAYFATLHIPLLQGRGIRASDRGTSAPVVVVNQALAQRLWPGRSALGQRIVLASQPQRPLTIVGVVRNAVSDFTQPAQPFVYVPLSQHFSAEQVLQARLAPGMTAPAMERALRAVDGHVPMAVQSMDEAAGGLNGLFLFRLGARLATWLGLLGLTLALVGVYGVVAYTAAQRTRELGIRMALGARPGQVVLAVVRQAVAVIASGMALGLGLAVGLGKLAGALLVGVSGLDPLTFVAATLLLAAVALAAALVPAWRVLRGDPLAALRCG